MKTAIQPASAKFDPAAFVVLGSFCFLLVFPMAATPAPAYVTGLPWKVELLSSGFISSLIAVLFLRHRESLLAAFSFDSNERSTSVIGCLALFLIWSAVSCIWSASPAAAAHHTLNWSIYLIAAILAARFAASSRISIAAFSFIAIVVGASAVFDHLTAEDFATVEGFIRIRYAKFAEMLVTVLPLIWAAAIVIRKPNKRNLLLISGCSGWIAVMLSLSKGAFIAGVLAFTFTFGVVLIFSARHRQWTLRTAGIWFVLTVGVQLLFTFGSNTASTAQYISGAADSSRSTAHMRIFTWKVTAEMIRDNLILGVGADNFGLRFNESRREYAVQHPEDSDLGAAEDYLVERAHDEPLQVFAELGIIGFALFAGGFLLLCVWAGKTILVRRNVSPVLVGCLGGMIGFGISSLFSSFSFRAVQNGLVFAIVLGIALKYLRRYSRRTVRPRNTTRQPLLLAFASLGLMILMILVSARMGISRFYQLAAEHSIDRAEQMRLLERSLAWDNENAAALSEYSAAQANFGKFEDAAVSLRASIDNGAASTEIYSTLAELYFQAGDRRSAQAAMAEAVSIYPDSVFARVRYAQVLEENGDFAVVSDQIAKARALDLKQANGWLALIRDGDLAAFHEAYNSKEIAQPSELIPGGAVLRYIGKSPFKASSK